MTERTQNLFQIKQRVITQKVRKPELSVLYATHHLVLIYISTKYLQNIPKSIQVTEQTKCFMLIWTLTRTPTGPVPKTICTPPPPCTKCPPHPPHTLVRGGGGGHNLMVAGIFILLNIYMGYCLLYSEE